jgi:hypothetical protein
MYITMFAPVYTDDRGLGYVNSEGPFSIDRAGKLSGEKDKEIAWRYWRLDGEMSLLDE